VQQEQRYKLSCPIGQIAQGIEFLTEAGQGNPSACDKHPVAAPNPYAGTR